MFDTHAPPKDPKGADALLKWSLHLPYLPVCLFVQWSIYVHVFDLVNLAYRTISTCIGRFHTFRLHPRMMVMSYRNHFQSALLKPDIRHISDEQSNDDNDAMTCVDPGPLFLVVMIFVCPSEFAKVDPTKVDPTHGLFVKGPQVSILNTGGWPNPLLSLLAALIQGASSQPRHDGPLWLPASRSDRIRFINFAAVGR